MTRFQIAGLCFTSAKSFPVHHDLNLVFLSYLLAAVGSYAALEMIERWRNAGSAKTRRWQIASALTLGGSIWSMHFVGMLALEINMPMTYAPGTTLLSLVIAVSSVGCGLQIIRIRTSWPRILCAGVTVGLGIAAMHYVGMSGMLFPGTLAYTPGLWFLSLLVGIVAATVALWLSVAMQATWQRAVSALVMGVAICGMHYVGIASTVFRDDPLAKLAPGLPSVLIAVVVTLVALALFLHALLFVAAHRRLLASQQREAKLLQQANYRLQKSNDQLARANAELELSRQQFDAALSNMSQGLTFFAGDQKLIVCNRRYREIYHLSPEQTRAGTKLSDIIDHRMALGTLPAMSRTDYLARRKAFSQIGKSYDITDELQDGRIISMHYEPLPNRGWVTTHEDVTERRRAEASIAFMAHHDGLTQLANRVLFQDRLEQAVTMIGRGAKFAVISIDLDHFKFVNDTLGHPAGDGLLRAAASRLVACVRDVDTVARLGGDEFAIVQLAVKCTEDAELLAKRIITAFSTPFDIDGYQTVVGTSIGIALAPSDGATAKELLKSADVALYLAKTEGRGTFRFYEPEMDARTQLRRTLELELRSAIDRSEFELYYQPIVNLATNKITSFEALVRWNHPSRGLLSPIEFIALAEETGLIVTIGEWVIRTACNEAENWPPDIRVAVNLSPVQFRKGNLVAVIQAALATSGLRPDRLELEITESVLLKDSAATLGVLHSLHGMGITVALDDFGTGYSSLSYLRSFPFDKIKIDQTFVRDLVNNKDSLLIIRAVIGLSNALSIKTAVEGLETPEQLAQLRLEGCTEAQGYIFGRPEPSSEIRLLIPSLNQTD